MVQVQIRRPAPLLAGLETTNGISKNRTKVGYRPCNLYVGPDFAVRISDWLAMQRLIADDYSGGIMHSDFLLTSAWTELRFSEGAFKLLTLPNAGGSSALSEALSFEVLQRCFKATLVKTEMEVRYFPMGGSMTDYVSHVQGRRVGVSVTRALKFGGQPFTREDATHLLNKKLKGVVQSSRNTVDAWSKQILHVWATCPAVAATLTKAYHRDVAAEVKANTVVLVTTATTFPAIFTNT